MTVSEWRRDRVPGPHKGGWDWLGRGNEPGQASRVPIPAWDLPILDEVAMHGPVGRYVVAAEPHTESDPATVLLGTLVALGTSLGPGPYVWAGNVRHGASLYASIVGQSAKAGVEGSWTAVRFLLEAIDPALSERRVITGDALIQMTLRDRFGPFIAVDPRVLVFTPSLTRLVEYCRERHSVLASCLNQAWDGHLRLPISPPPGAAAHLGLLANATAEELRSAADQLMAMPQLTSRMLFALARRTKRLPCGGNLPLELVAEHAADLRPVVEWARSIGAMTRTDEGERSWSEIYEELATDDLEGPLGVIFSRDVFHVLRISLIYALVDRCPAIDEVHVKAAAALWRYCRQSAACLFQPTIDLETCSIDPVTSRLLAAIRRAGADGLTLTQQLKAFGNNISAARLEEARQSLQAAGLVTTTRRSHRGPGRSPMISHASADSSGKDLAP